MSSYDVILPGAQTAIFPDRCPFTGEASPTQRVCVLTRNAGAGIFFWAGWLRVNVPASIRGRAIALRVQLYQALRNVLMIGYCFGLLALTLYLGFDGFLTGLCVFAICVVMIGCQVAWEQRHPPALKLFLHGDDVYYEFRDEAYAQEFAALNNGVVTRPKGFLG